MTQPESRSRQLTKPWTHPLTMLIVAVLAMLLYSRALNFAFFNDDPTGHFAWMETRSFLDFFNSSAEYGYYRPIVFVFLKSLVLLGGYQPGLFHAFLLLLHSANAGMLWLLALRLGQSELYAWAAALIFATVPFNYEAVAYVASLTHPLLLFWLLLTMLLYQNGRSAAAKAERNRSLFYDVAAGVTLLLGLFTHENGLLIPLALVGVEWLARPPRGLIEGFKRPFLPYFLPAILFFLLWLSIPKTSSQSLPSLSELISNLYPFLQTLVYPLLPLFQLSTASLAALLLIAAGAVAGIFLLAAAVQAVRLWAFALAWFFISILPAILFLAPNYLYGSPRLNYLPSVGLALLWALPVLALARLQLKKTWSQSVRGLGIALYFVLIILPPLPFIRCQLDFYEHAGQIIDQMSQAAREAPPGKELTLVNIPFFFSSYADHPQGCPNPYPWTPVGAVVMPPYARARDFIRFNGGPDRPVAGVTHPAFNSGWAVAGDEISTSELREATANSAVYLFDLTSEQFFNLSTAWQPAKNLSDQSLAQFGEIMQLLDAGSQFSGDKQEILVNLQWQVTGQPGISPVVFVHLYDAAGALISQHDAPPAENFIPTALWQPGDIIQDSHKIILQSPLPAGRYTLAAGLYDPVSGERFPATSNDGRLANDAVIIQAIEIP